MSSASEQIARQKMRKVGLAQLSWLVRYDTLVFQIYAYLFNAEEQSWELAAHPQVL